MNGEVSGGDNISSYTGTTSNRVINLGPLFSQAAYVRVAFRVRNGQSHDNAPYCSLGVEQLTPRAGVVLATALTLPGRPGRSARTYLMAYAIHAPGF